MSFLKFIIGFGVSLYFGLLVFLHTLQEKLIFPAPNGIPLNQIAKPFDRVMIETSDGETLFALHHPAQKDEATLIFFHGNGDAAIFQQQRGAAIS